jgi:flagellar basal-body rod modification protein FlgD
MAIDPVGTSTQQVAQTATLTADFNMFLRLLTTQLQYQDPLDPMDTSEYTQQLVSYSQVEQAIQQTQRLDAILARLSAQDLASAGGYIGREVSVYQPVAALDADGADWFYELDTNAAATRLTILDKYGSIVRTFDGETTAGSHALAWDGTNAAGGAMPEGEYALVVESLTAAGQTVSSRVGTRGIVTGVEALAGEIILNLGATNVRAADIAKISA